MKPQQLVNKDKVCFTDTCENPQGSWNYWERKSSAFCYQRGDDSHGELVYKFKDL